MPYIQGAWTPNDCLSTVYLTDFACMESPPGDEWETTGTWQARRYDSAESPVSSVTWGWNATYNRWDRLDAQAGGWCAQIVRPLEPGEYGGQTVVLPCMYYPTMCYTPGGGSMQLVEPIPADLTGWMVDLTLLWDEPAAGKVVSLWIGGQEVQYEIANKRAHVSYCDTSGFWSRGRASVSGGNAQYVPVLNPYYTTEKGNTLRVYLDKDEAGVGRLSVQAVPLSGTGVSQTISYHRLMRPLGPCDPHDRAIRISSGDAIGITHVHIRGVASEGMTEASPLSYRQPEQVFRSLCNHDSGSWNWNGSPCYIRVLWSWRAQYQTGPISF